MAGRRTHPRNTGWQLTYGLRDRFYQPGWFLSDAETEAKSRSSRVKPLAIARPAPNGSPAQDTATEVRFAALRIAAFRPSTAVQKKAFTAETVKALAETFC